MGGMELLGPEGPRLIGESGSPAFLPVDELLPGTQIQRRQGTWLGSQGGKGRSQGGFRAALSQGWLGTWAALPGELSRQVAAVRAARRIERFMVIRSLVSM